MRHKFLSLDSKLNLIGSPGIGVCSEDNRKDMKKMKALMQKAMSFYLTPRQQECMMMYYFEQKTVMQIGEEIGVDKSTVSRHLQAAMKKLKKLNAFI